jgi:phage baseplate assembly protein W
VERALATAIDAEVQSRGAGWEARVALLASELRARRLTRDGVMVLGDERPLARRR